MSSRKRSTTFVDRNTWDELLRINDKPEMDNLIYEMENGTELTASKIVYLEGFPSRDEEDDLLVIVVLRKWSIKASSIRRRIQC